MKDQWKHGGNVYEARRKLGVSRDQIVDLVQYYPVAGQWIKEALITGIDDLIHYPDLNIQN